MSTEKKNQTEEVKSEDISNEEMDMNQDNAPDSSVDESEQQQNAAEESNAKDSTASELAEYKDKFVRLYAEFENFRKRTNKEKMDLLSTASGGIIKDMLPVMDDFERAMANNENLEDPKALKEGFGLIYNKFKSILESKGLKVMDSKDKPFDPELQEAIANIPVSDDKLKGKVVDDVEKGYYLNDKVIRFAKVVVGQ